MKKTVPIYLTDIELCVQNTITKKETQIVNDKLLKNQIIKSFSTNHELYSPSFERIIKKIQKEIKLKRHEVIEIKEIIFIKQLDYGVNEF